MAGIGSLVDLLLFYTLERALYNRMVCSLGKNSQQVKKAIALWLMLEEIGYHDLIPTINSSDNATIESFSYEALHEFVYKRFTHIMDTVCDQIFVETKAVEVDESRTSRRASGQVIGETSRQSSLNPDASEFNPGQTPEDSPTMFLTFSLGHPLSRDEIIDFLTSNRGEVVQNVFIERTQPGKDAQFGRIVFTNSLVIPRILNGQTKAKFMVNRKHLWARIYVPRRRGSR
ncbi:hypothetical protein OIU79_008180 [Salix purpurea]|uniref:RRM domain-containing protein n=1 Tax=Salix purpurea TaxID=77065 RepID=A0A9Q0THS7_SALPP|nr:hypothetical protein OIU79_008180 [Salix purpurea]